MLNRLKQTLLNCSTDSHLNQENELKRENKILLNQNHELVNTIEQLYFKISQLEQYYFELLTVNNELLAQVGKYQSTQTYQLNQPLDTSYVEEVKEDCSSSSSYFDPLTYTIIPNDENKNLKFINAITSKYYPVPINEDENNVVIRYLKYDESLGKMTKNFTPWKERLTIDGERYYLVIQLDRDDRTWKISLIRHFTSNMPCNYKLKAVTDKGEDFENNEVIAEGNSQSISLLIELEEGEGLKFEIYPQPDDYPAKRIFWFY